MEVITKPVLVAKSSLSWENLQDKAMKGAKHLELHLFSEDANNVDLKIEGYLRDFDLLEVKVNTIHMPFDGKFQMDDFLCVNSYEKIREIFKLAEYIAQHQKSNPIIVLHAKNNAEIYKSLNVDVTIANKMDELFNEFPNVRVSLENSAMIRKDENNIVTTSSNYGYSTVKLVEHFNKLLKNGKLGTVLDICHALSDLRTHNLINLLETSDRITIGEYLTAYKDTLNVIHLANCIGLGLNNETHAQPYKTKSELVLLENIIKKIKLIGYNKNLVLEMVEDDYNDSQNWLSNKNIVEEMYSRDSKEYVETNTSANLY